MMHMLYHDGHLFGRLCQHIIGRHGVFSVKKVDTVGSFEDILSHWANRVGERSNSVSEINK